MTTAASKYISCVCMCTDYFIYILGQPKASATKSVLDDDAGSARDSPDGGGKGKETRRYKATRMTAAVSKYISCVCMCTDYFIYILGQPKASATKSVLDDDAGSARDSPDGGGKGKETRRYKATRMTAAASKYISCVCMCTDYILGQPKASATKSVLDDDAGSARDSPDGGGKGKKTRRYKATRMTTAASKYISCVFMCTDYFIYILGQPKASATKSVLDDDAGSARDSPGGGGKCRYRTRMTTKASSL